MKNVFLASTALILSAGIAAAEVTVGGNGRMGIVYDSVEGAPAGTAKFEFNSRLRIVFSASGETDGGVSFGGSVRADNAAGGAAGTAGSVFVSYNGMKLTMGDIDSAAKSATGNVSGVGYVNTGDLNEIGYLAGGDDEGALFEYAFGDATIYASVGQIADSSPIVDSQEMSVGAKYKFGTYAVAVGYENVDNMGTNVTLFGQAGFGAATVKAIYGKVDMDGAGVDFDNYALSLDYAFGATTVTGVYRVTNPAGASNTQYIGLGAAYDLGGGAKLVGSIAQLKNSALPAALDTRTVADFGMTMSF